MYKYFVSFIGSRIDSTFTFATRKAAKVKINGHSIFEMDSKLDCEEAFEDLQKAIEESTGLHEVVIINFILL